MDRDETVGHAVSRLKREIRDREKLVKALEACPGTTVPTTRRTRPTEAAIEMLRSADRPMHALTELVPALEAEGYDVSRLGFVAALLRTGRVVRTAPGTFAYRANVNVAATNAG